MNSILEFEIVLFSVICDDLITEWSFIETRDDVNFLLQNRSNQIEEHEDLL